jgi:multicomponent Na+:H+ antiporter subunit D
VIRVLAPLPVLLPMLAAGLTLVLGHYPRLQRAVALGVLTAVVAVSGGLLVYADQPGQSASAVTVGGWPGTLGITLMVDRLSATMLVVSSIVTLGVLIYSVGQGSAEDSNPPLSIFYPTYLILTAGVCDAFLSGDLFNLYVGFEVLLAASYVLLTLGGTGPRIRAGVTYVVMSLLSSLVFLAGIAFTYAATGTLNLAQLAVRLGELPASTQTLLQAVLLIAFCIKAAVFPLSAWLPDSYPTAPAPITAVFAGLLTKVGVYAIIRTQTLLFPGGALDDLLMWAALATMIIGVLGAIAQSDIKRMLSFTLLSHIGFMVFGIALATSHGISGAIFYVAHHILIQTTLFLAAGLVERSGGSTSVERLGGLARTAPLLAVLFFLPAMNLAGIPPFSGFLGKVGLLEAGAQSGGPLAWTLVIGGVVTSLLTLYAVAQTWNRAFWHPVVPDLVEAAGEDVNPRAPIPMMYAATAGFAVVTLALTVFAGPFYALTQRTADDLLLRRPYIDAVLDGGSSPTPAGVAVGSEGGAP